jgi:hypothetical protein
MCRGLLEHPHGAVGQDVIEDMKFRMESDTLASEIVFVKPKSSGSQVFKCLAEITSRASAGKGTT